MRCNVGAGNWAGVELTQQQKHTCLQGALRRTPFVHRYASVEWALRTIAPHATFTIAALPVVWVLLGRSIVERSGRKKRGRVTTTTQATHDAGTPTLASNHRKHDKHTS